jgi:glycosyltransferase involved in cell wall biosynthesis
VVKILVIHSAYNEQKTQSQVDIWRIWRPIREIKKHTDWEIVEQPSIIKDIKKYTKKTEFTEEEMAKNVEHLKKFDMIYASYTSFLDPILFTFAMVVQQKHGVKLVMDFDDNMFHINEDNIGWWLKMTHEKTFQLQQIVRNVEYITTSSPKLMKVIQERNPNAKIKLVPNFISEDYKAEPPDNKDILRIGYFGGASHYGDLHWTGVTEALQKLMHEYKNIHFESAGIPTEYYLPTKRKHYNPGSRGHAWYQKIFPMLQYDISIAPLLDNPFNNCKTAIKWQEATMMHSPLIASNVSPYKEQIRNKVDGLLVANDPSEWYKALKKLVDDVQYRKELVKNAQERVAKDYMIENKWTVLRDALTELNSRIEL